MDEDIANYIGGKNRQDCVNNLVQKIQEKSSSVLQFIECLQNYLTDSDIVKRSCACEAIGDVLNKLFESDINGQECDVLSEFFCARLKDHYSIHAPVLAALSTLTSFSHLPNGTISKILHSVVREVHVQSCMHTDRRNILNIISNALENHQKEVIEMGRDFVFNFIQIVDGEQDPRNLLLVFRLAHEIVLYGIDISPLVEEYFEVIGCYFPIDFQPPSNVKKDAVVITNEQLVTSLRKVLASTNHFAPFCLPMLIEKINSSLQSAKSDAIQTLKSCLKLYTVKDIKPHLKELWDSLRRETMYADTEQNENTSLEVVTALVKAIASEYHQPGSVNTELDSFIQVVKKDCLERLDEPLQENLVWNCSKLLIACGKASKGACMRVFKDMIPVIVSKIEDKELIIADRRMALEILVHIIKVCCEFNFDSHIVFHPVFPSKQRILSEFYNCVSHNSHVLLRKIALAGLVGMCKLGKVLDDEDIQILVGNIYSILNHNDNDILQDCYATLGYIATKHPNVVVESVIQPAIAHGKHTNRTVFLDTLASVCTSMHPLSTVCSYLSTELDIKVFNEENQEHVLSCLSCMEKIINGNCLNNNHMEYLAQSVFKPLLKLCINISLLPTLPQQCCTCCTSQDNFSSECITWPVMQSVAKSLQLICQNISPGQITNDITCLIFDIFVKFDLSPLKVISPTNNTSFNPFLNIITPLQSRLICLLTATVCSLPIDMGQSEILKLQNSLFNICCTSNDRLTYVAASKCLAGIINKQQPSKDEVIEKIVGLGSVLKTSKMNLESKMRSFALFVWTTKALTMCSHKSLPSFVSILLNLLSSDLGKVAADSFDLILRDSEEVLNKKCGARIRLMYKQRFFQMTLAEIVKGFEDTKTDDDMSKLKANYLTALSHMLKYVPKQVLQQNLQTLFPLLVNALGGKDAVLLESVLQTLYCLIEEAQLSIEVHIDTLIKHFIHLSTYPKVNVRVQALKCIGVLTLLPTYILIRHKKSVIRDLSKPLDDKKRLVRLEAVKARSEWCLVGESTT